jgi:serine O-acetyltransferase
VTRLLPRSVTNGQEKQGRQALMDAVRSRHPGFREAVLADARVNCAFRGERQEFRSGLDAWLQVLRLMVQTDAFVAQVAYRAKARLQALGVPLVPRIMHRIAMATAHVSIGDPVVVHPGIYIAHGQVVADGLIEIHPGVVLYPWVTLGLIGPEIVGPTIGTGARIGSGAKVLGKVHVGARARVAANAVVLNDVPDDATAVGIPARVMDAEGR